jgi:hypothetical protein
MSSEYDREYWKRDYHPLWKPHMEKVKALKERLKSEFGDAITIDTGLGANSNEWLKMPPAEKAGPDLTLYHEYKVLCRVEVSGSEKVNVPPQNIWIRPDKYEVAKNKSEKYWFWMVYPNATWILDAEAIEPHKDNVITVAPYGKPEKYIEIPPSAAYPADALFEWISAEIERRNA